MIQPRCQVMRSLGLEFWLPLPLLGLAFWLGTGFVMDSMLRRANPSTKYLSVEPQLSTHSTKIILGIKVKINARQGVSHVKVIAAPPSKPLKFAFPFTHLGQVEAALSQQLALPSDRVRELVRVYYDHE